MFNNRSIVIAIAFASTLTLLATGQPCWAQRPLPSTRVCTQCHFPKAGEIGIAEPTTTVAGAFCRQEEAKIWDETDKHRQSTFLLLNDQNRKLTNQILGFDIGEVLTFELGSSHAPTAERPTPPVDLVTAVRYRDEAPAERRAIVQDCLACHAPIAESTFGDPTVSTLEFGVSCQACHGLGSDYEAPHQHFTLGWRVLKAEVKESAFGMIDLRNPYKRAKKCAECHVGSWTALDSGTKPEASAPRRFVRHEWYAAGHPPLPSMEYVTFAAQMPAHWRTLNEKIAEPKPFIYLNPGTAAETAAREPSRRDFQERFLQPKGLGKEVMATDYLSANAASFASTDAALVAQQLPRSRDLLVSGLAVLATYAELVANRPAEVDRDFSLYDCNACHHELRARFPSDVRVRRTTKPGRVPPAFWTVALARVADDYVQATQNGNEAAAFQQNLNAWYDAFGARPLGDTAAMSAAGKQLQDRCDTLAQQLMTQPMTRGSAQQLLGHLTAPQNDEERDYHAARQYAWAIREVLRDLAGVPHRTDAPGLKPGATPPSVAVPADVLKALGLPSESAISSSDPQVSQRIDKLFGDDRWLGPLRLRLPAGQKETIVGHLGESLQAISSYDPVAFRRRLEALRNDFPPAKSGE